MDITEFLEARIDEDEAHATSGWARLGDSRWETTDYGQDFLTPSAAKAECAAKRAIIELHPTRLYTDEEPGFSMTLWDCLCNRQTLKPCPTIAALAAVYAWHPDYRQDWAL